MITFTFTFNCHIGKTHNHRWNPTCSSQNMVRALDSQSGQSVNSPYTPHPRSDHTSVSTDGLKLPPRTA